MPSNQLNSTVIKLNSWLLSPKPYSGRLAIYIDGCSSHHSQTFLIWILFCTPTLFQAHIKSVTKAPNEPNVSDLATNSWLCSRDSRTHPPGFQETKLWEHPHPHKSPLASSKITHYLQNPSSCLQIPRSPVWPAAPIHAVLCHGTAFCPLYPSPNLWGQNLQCGSPPPSGTLSHLSFARPRNWSLLRNFLNSPLQQSLLLLACLCI